ncbi:maleylacetate reductase [Paraburkholderia sp. CNPSo 3274]|uniref:maleylacetate reductase n=1 Tax=Paraburkholderia sp. CNPSo 3274 TaxID=2940932 RepID=UPI0020B8E0AF|nr:maleylacetate reductase [Paraburkholderia sp. CNPSo 3274]MCP3712435.1 maleylacetate reductase [Paraburkholderia sp. CNPSo 3274]
MRGQIDAFTYDALPARVVMGAGKCNEAAAEAARMGCTRPFVVTTRDQAALGEEIANLFDRTSDSRFAEAAMHTPWGVTQRALGAAQRSGADCVIAIGGGSSTGLSKAIALRTKLPQIVLPTTYAGSEMTPIIGETRDEQKHTQRTLEVLPEVVIYDGELTLSLPVALSVASGLNAIAHAVEALYAADANPVTSLMAEEGIAALAESLPRIVQSPRSVEARRLAQYGAWLCETCLGAVGMGLHHKICHVLGGTFDLAHAQTHAVMIPHVVAYNAHAASSAMTRIARALGARHAWTGLYELGVELDAPRSLRALGMPEAGIDRAMELIMKNTCSNPRAPDVRALGHMPRQALEGLPPEPMD